MQITINKGETLTVICRGRGEITIDYGVITLIAETNMHDDMGRTGPIFGYVLPVEMPPSDSTVVSHAAFPAEAIKRERMNSPECPDTVARLDREAEEEEDVPKEDWAFFKTPRGRYDENDPGGMFLGLYDEHKNKYVPITAPGSFDSIQDARAALRAPGHASRSQLYRHRFDGVSMKGVETFSFNGGNLVYQATECTRTGKVSIKEVAVFSTEQRCFNSRKRAIRYAFKRARELTNKTGRQFIYDGVAVF